MLGRLAGFRRWLKPRLRARIQDRAYRAAADILEWPRRRHVHDSLRAAAPYVREWREGLIDGVVAVGPFECMPSKIASSQFSHVAQHDGMLSLSVSLNGDPMDIEALDNFAYEVHARWTRQQRRRGVRSTIDVPPSRSRRAARVAAN